MLTILIPTHNRPKELRNALISILAARIVVPFKVIINCDDESVPEEIVNDYPSLDITFYKKKFRNWGEVYEFLIKQCETEYLYFLEDDDILKTNFDFLLPSTESTKWMDEFDYYFGYYLSHEREGVSVVKLKRWFSTLLKKNNMHKKLLTGVPEDLKHFQLGQLVIKKRCIKKIPINNDKYNDYYLFKDNPGSIKYIDKVFYKQGLSHYSIS